MIGTLLGANRARLKEIGANTYRSYGLPKIFEYIISKTCGGFAVPFHNLKPLCIPLPDKFNVIYVHSLEFFPLQQEFVVGDIHRLRAESTHVIVRKAQDEEETVKRTKKNPVHNIPDDSFRNYHRVPPLSPQNIRVYNF